MTEGRLCERCVHHCPWNSQGMGCSHWEVNRLLGAGPPPCDGVFFVEPRPIDLGKLKRDGVQANAQTIDTAPIARVKVYEDDPPAVKLLAPGLPPGKHDLYCVPISAAAELAALRARVTELEADAARYRWLRDQCSDVDVRAGLDWIAQEHDSIDAGIDAERGVQSAADAL